MGGVNGHDIDQMLLFKIAILILIGSAGNLVNKNKENNNIYQYNITTKMKPQKMGELCPPPPSTTFKKFAFETKNTNLFEAVIERKGQKLNLSHGHLHEY